MIELTKEEAIKRHRMLWNWIADETLRQKRFVTKWEAFAHFGWPDILNHCWCCEYSGAGCNLCLVDWGTGYGCEINGSPYLLWHNSRSYEDTAKYAREIANLPERREGGKNL